MQPERETGPTDSAASVISTSSSVASHYHKLSKAKLLAIVFTLCLLTFVSTLNSTVASTISAPIGLEYGINNLKWVAQSFMLTSTALQPIWGKVSDVFGRTVLVKISIYLFIMSSAIAAFSHSMTTLIVARALMGVGAGALQVCSIVILSDIVPIRQRGKFLGFISAAGLFGQSIGPLYGDVISRAIGWRWTMVLNIPYLFIASNLVLFVIIIPIPKGSFKNKVVRIDFLGAILAVFSAVLILVAFDVLGGLKKLDTVVFYVLVALGVVLVITFIVVEKYTKKDPVISYKVLREHNVWVGFVSAMTTGVIIYATLFMLPTFLGVIYRGSSFSGSVQTWPWAVGAVVATVVCGISMSFYGNYKPYLIIGGMLLVTGLSLLLTMHVKSAPWKGIVFTLLIGLGIGFRVPSVTIEAQCVVKHNDLASTTALINFSRNVGGVIGMAFAKQVLRQDFVTHIKVLIEKYPEYEEQFMYISEGIESPLWEITNPVVLYETINKYLYATRKIIYICIGFASVGFLLSLITKKVQLINEEENPAYPPNLKKIETDVQTMVGSVSRLNLKEDDAQKVEVVISDRNEP